LKNYLIALVLLCRIVICEANNDNDYYPNHKKIDKEKLIQQARRSQQAFVKKVAEVDFYKSSEAKKFYDEKIKALEYLINVGQFYNDDTTYLFINGLFNKIQNANPDLKSETTVLISKSIIPNAYSWGGGIYVINAGLIAKYRSEKELAFVISHEIAHNHLDHDLQQFLFRKELEKSTGVNKNIKRALRKKYQAYYKANEILKAFNSDVNLNSQEQELLADSLGVIAFLRAGYSVESAISSLKLLDSIDKNFFDITPDFKKLFSDKDYVFKDEWLINETPTETVYKEEVAEISTHPDCNKRIEKLKARNKYDEKLSSSGDLGFYNIKAYYENLEYSFSKGNYLYALYFGLQLKKTDTLNHYLNTVICGSLYNIAYALRNHRFNEEVPMPHPDFDEGLNKLIIFLNNINFSNYKYFIEHFHRLNEGQETECKKVSGIYAKALDLDKNELNKVVEEMRPSLKLFTLNDILTPNIYESKK
jgi:hypothetical protein